MKTMPLPLNIENVVNRFIEMVQIDSPSGDEGKMQAYLLEWCKAFDPTFAITYETDDGGNLIVDIPSSQCSHSQRLILSGHMDVVPPCLNVHPVIEGTGDDRVISSDNTTVLGADDKAGLTAIMEAVRVSLEENRPRPALRLLFTTREETYLGGAKDLSNAALQGDFAVTLDHTGVQGTIIHQAPSYFEWTVECLGKSVHAGIMPEKGVNAIVFASKIIHRLSKENHLGRIDPLTTANVGFLSGGKATNVVPDLITLKGELRGHDANTLEKELASIQTILEEEKQAMAGADYRFQYQEEFTGFCLSPDHPGIQRVITAAEKTGLTPKLISTNGGSDQNVFFKRGLPGIVLSAGYIAPHSLKEQVKVKEMRQSTEFLIHIIEEFAAHAL